jgi:3-oxoacyl-[acyl-carrier-protein] synthase-3
MQPMFAGVFSYALGDRKFHVTDSADAGRLLSSANDLADAGFRWHHICEPETTAYDLARAAVAPIAERTSLNPDAIVYATCLPLNGAIAHPDQYTSTRDVKYLMDFPVSRLQADFGLDNAVAIGLNQQACTSMLGSLRIANALLAAEPAWDQVLCVTADRFPDGAIYEQAYNLISDGAAACLVTRSPSDFRIVASHQITNGGLAQASDDETVGTYFSYMHRLVKEVIAKAGIGPADLAHVVTQNTHEKAWTILSRLIGVSPERVAAPSLPDVGHVISADNVVNLTALLDADRIKTGDKLLLVMAGFGLNWQATILEAL